MGGRTIDNSIKKGFAKVKVLDLLNMSDYTINQKYKELLTNLVYDTDLLEILASEENMKKKAKELDIKLFGKAFTANINGKGGIYGKRK